MLSERAPRLARIGVVAIALAGMGVLASLVLTLVPGPPMSLIDGLFITSSVALLAGFLLLGIASVRTATPSKLIGVLLLVTTAIFVVWVVLNAATGAEPPDWAITTLAGVITLVTLALGVLLRTATLAPDQTASVDTTP